MQSPKFRSRWWYLLPVFMGVVGGLIAWYALKNDDKKLAKNCLVVGSVLTTLKIGLLALSLFSDDLNLLSELRPISNSDDIGFQFQFESP